MTKIVLFLSVALGAAIVVGAATGHVDGPMSPRFLKQATLIDGEYGSVAIDETRDGKVLRVVREGDSPAGPNGDVPCGDCAPQCDNGYDDDGISCVIKMVMRSSPGSTQKAVLAAPPQAYSPGVPTICAREVSSSTEKPNPKPTPA